MWKSLLCAALLAHAGAAVCATSQSRGSYPDKPIRLIEPFAPGGTSNYVARAIASGLTDRLNQPVIVDNRTGAGGNLGAEIAARANPDGYTLLLGVSSALAPSRSLYAKLGYDLLKDFSYISSAATGAQVLVVHPSVPAKSVPELVALTRSKPNAIRYGSAGVGSTVHLASELLQSRTGMQLLHVPYKGGAPAVAALLGGEVQIVFSAITTAAPMIKAKRLNALAVSGPKRNAMLPDVPTMVESGYPAFYVASTFGLLAPAGTPAAIVKLLNAEVRNSMQSDDVRARFATQGLEPAGSTPDEWKRVMQGEVELWARVIKDAKITAE